MHSVIFNMQPNRNGLLQVFHADESRVTEGTGSAKIQRRLSYTGLVVPAANPQGTCDYIDDLELDQIMEGHQPCCSWGARAAAGTSVSVKCSLPATIQDQCEADISQSHYKKQHGGRAVVRSRGTCFGKAAVPTDGGNGSKADSHHRGTGSVVCMIMSQCPVPPRFDLRRLLPKCGPVHGGKQLPLLERKKGSLVIPVNNLSQIERRLPFRTAHHAFPSCALRSSFCAQHDARARHAVIAFADMSEEPPLTLSTLLRGTGSLVGISTGDAAGTVIATIQRDGITAFDIATQV